MVDDTADEDYTERRSNNKRSRPSSAAPARAAGQARPAANSVGVPATSRSIHRPRGRAAAAACDSGDSSTEIVIAVTATATQSVRTQALQPHSVTDIEQLPVIDHQEER
jgi:hypothetical protein